MLPGAVLTVYNRVMGTWEHVVSRCHISAPCQHKPYIPKVENTSSTSQSSGEVLEGWKQSVPCLLATSGAALGFRKLSFTHPCWQETRWSTCWVPPAASPPLVLEGAGGPSTCLPLPPRLAGPRRSCRGLCCSGPPRREQQVLTEATLLLTEAPLCPC